MAFTQETFAPVGPQSAPSPSAYTYSSTDDLATVATVGYFINKQNQLEQDDIIFASLSDGYSFLKVSSDTSTAEQIQQSKNNIITDDAQMRRGDSALFSTGTNTFTMIDPSTTSEPIQCKSRSGTLTLTNPFGNVILPAQTGSSVTLTTSESVILWPVGSDWEYNG